MLPAFLFLLGQYRLQHVAGLGDMGEVDFGHNALWGTGSRRASAARTRAAVKMLAHFLGLEGFQGAGVRLAAIQAEFHQNLKNPLALDFHLACEIVDTNLTHPPLFKICYPMPVSRSWLPLGVGCSAKLHDCPIGRRTGGAF
jgi:hypothetical protein